MATETGLKLHRIYSELAKSPHGKLEEYLPIGKEAAKSEPEFLAHLIAWNAKKGDIRDSKVALPLLALDFIVARGQRYGRFREYEENALAHLALLSPRDLLRGWRFANAAKLAGRRHALFNLVKMYLGNLERGPHSAWDRMVVQHRRSLHELYALSHTRPQQVFGNEVRAALFGEDAHGNKLEHRAGSTLDVIARLKDMDPATAAGEVIRRRIPFLIAAPALGAKLKDPAVLSAVIERMSPTELISHMKMLEKLGVKKNPVLRATLEKVMTRLETAKVPVFKIGKALEKTESGGQIEGEELRERLSAIQNKQMDKGSVEGDWLVLADCSGSMESAVRIARMVSGCLSRMAKGRVHLVFFNSLPRYFDVSGKTIEELPAAS